jgi:DNA mismatch endonuclease (patch repair protein)
MGDWWSQLPQEDPLRRWIVSGNRRRDTRPERALRQLLHARGLRFRVDHLVRLDALTVRPDVVFTRWQVAVFVDGCFWHSCPEHGNIPRRNVDYWVPKLKRNTARDRRIDAALHDAGWRVVRAWEHEPPDVIAELVVAELHGAEREPSREGSENSALARSTLRGGRVFSAG